MERNFLIMSSSSRASLKYNMNEAENVSCSSSSISELADFNDPLCLSILLHTDKLSQDTIHNGSSSPLASARGITPLHDEVHR